MAGGAGENAQAAHEAPEVGGIAAERLRSIVERVERLQGERKALSVDIADIYAEARSAGFDTKALRRVIRERGRDPVEVEEEDTAFDLYRRALGM